MLEVLTFLIICPAISVYIGARVLGGRWNLDGSLTDFLGGFFLAGIIGGIPVYGVACLISYLV